VPIPSPILEFHRQVTLCVDFFFVQGIPFLHTISRKIGYRESSATGSRHKTEIIACLRKSIANYENRGFAVDRLHADEEFRCIADDIAPISVDICAADEHVAEVERSIRTIKETIRATVHGMPFKRLPRVMIKALVEMADRVWNDFPAENGISDTLSPNTIVTGNGKPDYNRLGLEFGSYAQVYDGTSNDQSSRTLGAIALNPTSSGTMEFMSLVTGAKITRGQWVELPIHDAAIGRVHTIAKDEGMPLVQGGNLIMEWNPNEVIEDDAYDRDYEYESSSDEDLEDADYTSAEEITGYTTEEATTDDSEPENDSSDDSSDDDDESDEHSDVGHVDGVDDEPIDSEDDRGVSTAEEDSPPLAELARARFADDEALEDDDGDSVIIFDDDEEAPHDPGPAQGAEDGSAQGAETSETLGAEEGAQAEAPAPEADTHSYNLRATRDASGSHRFAHSVDNPAGRQTYDKPFSFMATHSSYRPS
jgi:hypothetical protein